jgi:hypothetical protein
VILRKWFSPILMELSVGSILNSSYHCGALTFLSTEILDNLIEKKIQNLLFDISKKTN